MPSRDEASNSGIGHSFAPGHWLAYRPPHPSPPVALSTTGTITLILPPSCFFPDALPPPTSPSKCRRFFLHFLVRFFVSSSAKKSMKTRPPGGLFGGFFSAARNGSCSPGSNMRSELHMYILYLPTSLSFRHCYFSFISNHALSPLAQRPPEAGPKAGGGGAQL